MSLSVYGFDTGALEPEFTILGTTGATVIVKAQDNPQTVVSVTATNVTASPANLTLEVYTGAISYKFLQAYPVPAIGVKDSVYTYELPIRLPRDFTVRATAGTANALHIITNSVLAVGRTTSS